MKAVISCRVSSRDQEETGYSLPAQEKFLSEYTLKKGFEIDKVFSAAESASRKKRRQIFNEMMKYLRKKHIHVLIYEKVDRCTRSHKDAVLIDEWIQENKLNQVHFVKNYFILNQETKASDRFMWNIHVSKAEYDLDNLSEEVKKGQKGKIDIGWYPGHLPPLGYKNVRIEGKVIQIIDEVVAPFIRKTFELYSTGDYSVDSLAKQLYELGLRSRGNKELKGKDIHRILINIFYVGQFKWNSQIHQGNHEKMISIELFMSVQKLLKRNRPLKYSKHDFLFKSIISCENCQGTITWECQKGHNYGHCSHYKPCNNNTWVKDYQIEGQLKNTLELLQIKNPRIREWIYKGLCQKFGDTVQFQENATKLIQANINQELKKQDNLVEMRSDGEIDKETFLVKKNKSKLEVANYQEQLKKVELQSGKYAQLQLKLYQISQKAKEVYSTLQPDQKRALIKLIYSTLELGNGSISYEYTVRFKALAKAVELTNCSKIEEFSMLPKSIFEPQEKIIATIQNPSLLNAYVSLRRGWDSNPR